MHVGATTVTAVGGSAITGGEERKGKRALTGGSCVAAREKGVERMRVWALVVEVKAGHSSGLRACGAEEGHGAGR